MSSLGIRHCLVCREPKLNENSATCGQLDCVEQRNDYECLVAERELIRLNDELARRRSTYRNLEVNQF